MDAGRQVALPHDRALVRLSARPVPAFDLSYNCAVATGQCRRGPHRIPTESEQLAHGTMRPRNLPALRGPLSLVCD